MDTPPRPRLWSLSTSPFAGKVRAALAEKGAEVDIVEIDPRDRPARLRELNPVGRVPELAPGAAEHPRLAAWLDALRDRPSAAAIDQKGTAFEQV